MYQLNLLDRDVLITPAEVIRKSPVDHTMDPLRLVHAIEIAEERFVIPLLGAGFYAALARAKNVTVTAGNIADLQQKVGVNEELEEGDIVNASEFLDAGSLALWRERLWKFTAECVRYIAIPENYASLTSEGLMRHNPIVPVIGATAGSSASIGKEEAKWLMDKWLQDRITPLQESLKGYLCLNKAKYPLYGGDCGGYGDCAGDSGTGTGRKTEWVTGLYDDDQTHCSWP